jgi:nucleotidyltransferase/DNA polymerase involved in DNA repair
VFRGCENLDSEFKIRKCFSESISNHFRENFDLDILTNNPIKRKRVYMRLLINQKGEVSLTRSPRTNIYLESEIRRVTKGLPKLIPGIRHGLHVSIKYTVSIGIVDNKIDIKSGSGIY